MPGPAPCFCWCFCLALSLWLFSFLFFPFQVTVVRFCVSCPAASASASSAGPQLQALDRNVPCRTRTASSGCVPRRTSNRALDRSVHRRAWTATYGARCCPPDLSCKRWIAVFPLDPNSNLSTASVRSAGLQLQVLDRTELRQTRTASTESECSQPKSQCSPLDPIMIRVVPMQRDLNCKR